MTDHGWLEEGEAWRAVNVRRVRAFEDETWADASEIESVLEALFETTPSALPARFWGAIERRDLKATILTGRILERHQAHTRKTALHFGEACLARGLYEEALGAFAHPSPEAIGPKFRLPWIRALAGTGRLREALTAADEAVAERPDDLSLAEVRDRLQRLEADGAHHPPLAWNDIKRRVEDLLVLGLGEPACDLLDGLMNGRIPAAPLSMRTRLDLADLALAHCDPERVRLYVQALPDKFPDRKAALLIGCDVLQGRQAPSAAMQSAPRVWRALAQQAAGEFAASAQTFGALSQETPGDLQLRAALAYSVGRSVLESARPRFARDRSGRLVNVVMFNDEFTLLRMHLEEMESFVDTFVIVEAGQTFTGLDKPLQFALNREAFADFEDRIVHVPIPRFPSHISSPWAREFHQRDMGIQGASGLCGEDDYILETDTDEIVRGPALEGFSGEYAAIQLRTSRFFLNYRPLPQNPDHVRPASSIFRAKYLARYGLSYARFVLARGHGSANVIPHGGWHFTSVADAAGISRKVKSYAHQEQAKDHFKSEPHFQAIIDRLKAGELDPGWERAELEADLPPFVARNREALKALIL